MQFIERHALRICARRARPIALGTLAAAGAAAGSAVTKAATKQAGLEITVERYNGDMVSVVRAADEAFDEGGQVRVLMRLDGSAGVVQ